MEERSKKSEREFENGIQNFALGAEHPALKKFYHDEPRSQSSTISSGSVVDVHTQRMLEKVMARFTYLLEVENATTFCGGSSASPRLDSFREIHDTQ